MKKLLIASALLIGAGALLHAAGDCVIRTSDDRDMQVDEIKALPTGDLEYVSGASKIRSKVQKGKYKYAWIPKPKEISDADAAAKGGDFKKAADAYKKAYDAYKLLGWDVYCIFKEGESIAKQGAKPDAIKRLAELKGYKLLNSSKQERDLMDAYKLLASLYIETGDNSSAEPILDEMGKAKEEDLASFSLNKRGDILTKQGKKKDAVEMYLQTSLLFPKSPERPEALFKAATLLKEMNDSRYVKFSDMLKSEYPSDPLVKQLK